MSFHENAGHKVWALHVVAEATMSPMVKLESEIDELASHAGPLSAASRPWNAVESVSKRVLVTW